jgi:hypothetical protein
MNTPTKQDVERIANKWMRKQAAAPARTLSEANQNMAAITRWLAELSDHVIAMNDLWNSGEQRRKGRTGDVRIGSIKYDGKKIVAKVAGRTANYKTAIQLPPQRGHYCSCPDWEKNRKAVGPCKHILKLSQVWLYNNVVPALEGTSDRLMGVLEHAEL